MGLIGWVGLCLLAELLASFFTSTTVGDWYVQLAKPGWTPPGWVFGPVWTFLYVSMGVAIWLVRAAPLRSPWAVPLFLLQLVLNVAWTWVFFYSKELGWAAWEIGALWLAILAAAIHFRPASRLAAALMVPYLAWVSFALALNVAIWKLNP